ncbi:FAD binding domain-containing protein [Cladophialophora immunda]|nr:FAD binding domain-containing protein [Cladophialophora immunda]
MASKEVHNILCDKFGKSKVSEPRPGELKYFAAQSAALVPAVQVFPENAKDVSTILQIVRDHQVPFAVKAGGHGVYAGASSIEDGILVDLSRMNSVDVAPERKSVFIGAGAKWVDVYGKLDALGISVPGGRISTVGVGGLTLGGGISFAASRFGLACDNVKSYEVVLADGSVVTVTRETHPDLFWALRGAGTNFGIVTRFEFVAFEQGQIWGGVKQYLEGSEAQAIALLDKFCKGQDPASSAADVFAEAFIIIAYVAPMGKFITTAVLSHGKPEEDPPIFDGFKTLPSIASSTKIRSIADLSVELNANNPHGLRSKTLALAVKSDITILNEVMAIYKDVISPHKDTVKDFVPAILLQPLLPRMLPSEESDHTLGISKQDGPLFVISLLWSWTEPTDDDLIESLACAFEQRVTATAKAHNKFHRYVYLNYAAGNQDVFASYGEENLARLLHISKQYDANGVFTKLRPGYINVTRNGHQKNGG